MKKTVLAAMIALGAMTAQASHAQMRVTGQRPVDPRLRNHPQVTEQAKPATRIPGGDAESIELAPAAAGRTATASRKPAVDGGPLQRPTYLQEGEGTSPAAGPSAIELMKQCFDGSISGGIVNPTCIGYMAGAIGAIRMAAQTTDQFPICLPENGLSNEAVVGDVSAYLEENTESLQKSARSVLFLVLAQRHPCGKGGR